MSAQDIRHAVARLREGTEVLRTGGGARLTSRECDLIISELEALRAMADAGVELHERVEMDESVGVCLSDRRPSLRFGDAYYAYRELVGDG